MSCNNIALPQSGTETLIRNGNGSLTSTWEFTASFQTILGVAVSTFVGEITDGVLEGATLTKVTEVAAGGSSGGHSCCSSGVEGVIDLTAVIDSH